MSEFYLVTFDIYNCMAEHFRLSRAIMTLQLRLQKLKDCYVGGALPVDELAYLEYLWGIASILVSPGKSVFGDVDEIGELIGGRIRS